ncbi:MAG: hypothetical protein VXA48_13340, partial [Deltaproteobacteria bacterium]
IQESEAPVEKLVIKTVRCIERMFALIFFEIHRPRRARNIHKILKSDTLPVLPHESNLPVSPDMVVSKYMIFND